MPAIQAQIDSSLLDRFAAIVGPAYALRNASDIRPYVHEERGLFAGRSPLVLRPGGVAEVSRILKLASETGTPVVPQGGNTGLVGGGVPDASGREIVVSLSRLDRIREIDVESNTMTAEAGVVLQKVQEAARDADRYYPLTIGSQGSCQVGGNLSTNAGGTGVLAFGSARELCLGVEVVLPTGEVLDDLRKLKKDNTGYDLKNLFVGAEGTLGIITAAVLKLFPKPKGREVAWAGMTSPEAALAFFIQALGTAGNALTAFEFFERRPVDFAIRHMGVRQPLAEDWPCYVLLDVSSNRSAEDARAIMETVLSDALEAGTVGDAVIAASIAQGAAFWGIREAVPPGQAPEGASIKHDISVPIASIPAFIGRAADAVQSVSPGARVCCFGHLGDGNLHYNITQPVGADRNAFLALYKPMHHAVHGIVREFGGSISAEHGIGRMKREELIATAPPVGIDLMRRIKASFDPAGIMNPGKVI